MGNKNYNTLLAGALLAALSFTTPAKASSDEDIFRMGYVSHKMHICKYTVDGTDKKILFLKVILPLTDDLSFILGQAAAKMEFIELSPRQANDECERWRIEVNSLQDAFTIS